MQAWARTPRLRCAPSAVEETVDGGISAESLGHYLLYWAESLQLPGLQRFLCHDDSLSKF